jgi:hypothetical protein
MVPIGAGYGESVPRIGAGYGVKSLPGTELRSYVPQLRNSGPGTHDGAREMGME